MNKILTEKISKVNEFHLAKLSDVEVVLLGGMIGVVEQYMSSTSDDIYDHANMSAGEDVVDILMHYGVGNDDGYSIVLDKKAVDAIYERALTIDFFDTIEQKYQIVNGKKIILDK